MLTSREESEREQKTGRANVCLTQKEKRACLMNFFPIQSKFPHSLIVLILLKAPVRSCCLNIQPAGCLCHSCRVTLIPIMIFDSVQVVVVGVVVVVKVT